jgi:hypothetical protein
METPACPKCEAALFIGRIMFLRSVNVYYSCSSRDGCGRFTFDNDGRGFSNVVNLRKAFDREFIPEYSI